MTRGRADGCAATGSCRRSIAAQSVVCSLLVHRMPAGQELQSDRLAVLISAANGEMILIYLLLIISAAKSPLPGYCCKSPSAGSLREVGASIGRCVFFGPSAGVELEFEFERAGRWSTGDGQAQIGRMRACAAPNEINRQMHSI